MLSVLNMVGNWFKNEPEAGWRFDEIKFDDEAKRAFELLDLDIEVFEHSARVDVSGNNNHCYIPSHYFLYALKLQPLVSLLTLYMDIFRQVKSSTSSAVDFDKLINSSSPSNPVLDVLDHYSRDNFFDVFRSDKNRLGGKNIINQDPKKGKKYRSDDDFMCSIILKALPVPDASSSMLGDLIYAFSRNPTAYQTLADKYSAKLPYVFRSSSADDLLFMIILTLALKGKVDSLLGSKSTVRFIGWGSIVDAFLLSKTPVSGNNQYIEKPVHYSTLLNQYVHIKKGLLDTDASIVALSALIAPLWPKMSIIRSGTEIFFRSSILSIGPDFKGATNKIFYGAPGTGKSHRIHTEEYKVAEKIVTVFHPDTQYSDFVGALKPHILKENEGNSGVTYLFRPGPFTNALVKAKAHPDTHICLVIEEINRAPAAAVFGELFQLLDRNTTGESTYKIDAADPDMLTHINDQLRVAGISELKQLEIPANLSILATMNSSDQAVMPLDTAFKRRWSFEYLEINFANPAVPNTLIYIQTANGQFSIEWPKLAQSINDVLIETGVTEDRLIGPFFLSPTELIDSDSAKLVLNSKLFVYLWDDVLRHLGPHKVFSSTYKTFGTLSRAYIQGSAVFSSAIEREVEAKGMKVEVAEASQDAEK
ncbi:AAA family ATPase [Shewanella sp. OMA3-2]|uniref:AAA family ATPase n=1 Tax=Shewanella sp. OMA3-2 TaxID=2908650 RepID=UPI001F235953|nr:AAA family ATPase [Shewanella sp. OMA3-2]UJF22036.1 AAA family ATPase [Shewanella sp. OMA3-2]